MDPVTALALAARSGDHRAVADLIAATEPDLRRLCALIGRRSEIDDLVQETYIRAVGALSAYRGEAPAKSWLFGIARHVCLDDLRRAGRQSALADRIRANHPRAHHPERSGEVAIAALLGALERDQLEAFVLTQLQGCSYEEAAQICDCAVGTIRSRVSRARARLVELVRAAEAS